MKPSKAKERPLLENPPPTSSLWPIYLALATATILVYWQVHSFEFVNYDDTDYVKDNPIVQRGLSLENVRWALTTGHASNWHPVTWLSHMLDCSIFGVNPGAHHLTNLFFHVANALLLFGILKRVTGAIWRSAFVAALFALHPLHVESVAWVAERKDVLCAFFGLLAIEFYVAWTRRPRTAAYVAMLVSFACSLLSKPMLVTLPFALLLLDFWPLARTRSRSWTRLVVEKLPLFALAAAACVVAVASQKTGGALGSGADFPLGDRVSNALVSYVAYVAKTLFPVSLAALYPYPKEFPLWRTFGAALFLALATTLALSAAKRRPYAAFGWLWFLGTLVPVVGLVQIGRQSMADRYAYVPLVGLFAIVAWGAPELLARRPRAKTELAAAGALGVGACAALAFAQVGTWRDSETMWRHAIEVTKDNATAHNNFGAALNDQRRFDEAEPQFEEALRVDPVYADAHNNLGVVRLRRGKLAEAESEFRAALPLVEAHDNLGQVLEQEGKFDAALAEFEEAVRLAPDRPGAHVRLGRALGRKGDLAGAEAAFRAELHLAPDSAEAHESLGVTVGLEGRLDEAIHEVSQALAEEPENAAWRFHLGRLLDMRGDPAAAAREFETALRLDPNLAPAREALDDLRSRGGGK